MKMAALEKTAPSFFKLDNKSDTLESNMSTKLKNLHGITVAQKMYLETVGEKAKISSFLVVTTSTLSLISSFTTVI